MVKYLLDKIGRIADCLGSDNFFYSVIAFGMFVIIFNVVRACH